MKQLHFLQQMNLGSGLMSCSCGFFQISDPQCKIFFAKIGHCLVLCSEGLSVGLPEKKNFYFSNMFHLPRVNQAQNYIKKPTKPL
jgi:hypothetical protein